MTPHARQLAAHGNSCRRTPAGSRSSDVHRRWLDRVVGDQDHYYKLWRPYRDPGLGDTDGNRKTDGYTEWAPLINTPCFPSYPSSHASRSHAAAEALPPITGENGTRHQAGPTIPVIGLATWSAVHR